MCSSALCCNTMFQHSLQQHFVQQHYVPTFFAAALCAATLCSNIMCSSALCCNTMFQHSVQQCFVHCNIVLQHSLLQHCVTHPAIQCFVLQHCTASLCAAVLYTAKSFYTILCHSDLHCNIMLHHLSLQRLALPAILNI